MNKIKYCKFCDKEKPEEDFCKSGGFIKNICRDCQNKKQRQIYQDSKRTKQLEQEIERLNNIMHELEKYCNEEIEDYDKAINSKILSEIGRDKYEAEKMCFLDILDKLKELKGSDKE